ncbi:MAG TPA: glycosyltransferase [Bacteroidales bacterium]|nr:glycosyltransferase [Bacteroidales bacterium]
MKIAMFLDNKFPPDPRVENEAISLIQDNHEVHLFCIDYSHEQKSSETINGIIIHRVKPPKFIRSLSALAYTIPIYHLVLSFSIYFFIKKFKPARLHVHDMQIARSVFWVNKIFKLPLTLDLHENRPEIMKHYFHVNTPLGKSLISPKKWKKFEFRYIVKASNVITVTDEAAEYYVNHVPANPEKFLTVPNTVRKAFYLNYQTDNQIISKYKGRFTLLYLGDTGLRRGLLTVFESLKFLVRQIPEIIIVVVGNSKEDHILTKFVTDNHYQNYVDFTGWQDFHLFQSYILAAHAGICPIHKNIHHDTTYANKLFQYMAFGKPIIVSDCLSQKNLVEKYNCGLVFSDRNSKDFGEKILSIYKDRNFYNMLSTNAENAVKNHLNWEITSAELKNLYNNERNSIK